jgi:hypothetical protein
MNDEVLFQEDEMSAYGFEANRRASRATQAWLMGRGLAAEAQDLQTAPIDGNTPAPGLFTAVRMMGDACTESYNAADVVFQLLRQEFDEATEEKLSTALEASSDAAREVERWMRRIAALCIGLSAYLATTDATQRSDRAAVVALKLASEPVDLVDDGLWHNSTRFDELSTALAGDLGRMIIDHDCILVAEGTGAEDSFRIEFEVDSVGNLSVRLSGAEEVDTSALIELGWTEADGTYRAEWDDPLPIAHPVWLVVTTLEEHLHVPSPTELRFSIERTGSVGDG